MEGGRIIDEDNKSALEWWCVCGIERSCGHGEQWWVVPCYTGDKDCHCLFCPLSHYPLFFPGRMHAQIYQLYLNHHGRVVNPSSSLFLKL